MQHACSSIFLKLLTTFGGRLLYRSSQNNCSNRHACKRVGLWFSLLGYRCRETSELLHKEENGASTIAWGDDIMILIQEHSRFVTETKNNTVMRMPTTWYNHVKLKISSCYQERFAISKWCLMRNKKASTERANLCCMEVRDIIIRWASATRSQQPGKQDIEDAILSVAPAIIEQWQSTQIEQQWIERQLFLW